MDSISSVDTSFYSELIEGFAPKTTLAVPAVQAESVPQESGSGYTASEHSDVDLSNYYSTVRPDDLLVKTGQNVVEAAQVLDNSMVIALQNGYSVQDVCNIKLAEQAYRASALVFKAANEMSTFALDV